MRYRNWAHRLHETIQGAVGREFVWGEMDCCLFAADCIVAVCGTDPAAEYRGQYGDETEAKRALVRLHGGIEEALDAHFERVPVAFAQRGDVCLHEAPQGKAVAVRWAGAWWGMTEEYGACRVQVEPLIVWRIE